MISLRISNTSSPSVINMVVTAPCFFASSIFRVSTTEDCTSHSISFRLSPNVIITGNVLLNGKQRSTASRNISYVTQEDHLLGSLTVRETLTYSAHLRLPSTLTNSQINEVVETTTMKMGLEECAATKIGNWHSRGISGGEKRRLSIGLEMLTQPHLMFLDEPTSGLDSASAFFVIHALKNIALEGKIVICSIHQPSSFVFDLFDDLCLLSSGDTIYFGEAKAAIQFFSDAGFPCPTRRNPSDHFLRCVNSDFDKILSIRLQSQRDAGSPEAESSLNLTTQNIKEKLIEEYRNSAYSINTRKMIREITLVDGPGQSTSNLNMNEISWWKQLITLTNRSSVNMTRDLGYYWLRIVFLVVIALGAGIMFFNIGLSSSSILSRAKFYTYFFDFFLCLCVGGLPSFIEEWKVSYYERLNMHYGEGVFVFANFFSSFPFLVLAAVSSVAILCSMVKFHMGFSIFFYFFINMFFCISIMESITMTIALLVPNFLMGIGVSAAVIMFLTIASGLYRPLPELPNFFWRYPMSYISYTSWAVKGLYKNDMVGLEFEPIKPGQPKMKGEQVLATYFGVDSNQSKWWDLGAVLLLFLCHRVIFFMVLKYKDRVVWVWRKRWMKQSLEELGKRSSFRMERVIPSKRHQPLHSLSSQEGLTSPLQ
ncbi:ABC transporter G family member 12-like isoform X2 [Euphorbia lathyris]|uniref:ABC transporter G family member 12-like isoform X2 n=1 Tax=Euphorbia lathyris TaxID=212925 RepID=UPI003313B5A7